MGLFDKVGKLGPKESPRQELRRIDGETLGLLRSVERDLRGTIEKAERRVDLTEALSPLIAALKAAARNQERARAIRRQHPGVDRPYVSPTFRIVR